MHWRKVFGDVKVLIIQIGGFHVKRFRYQQCEKMDYIFQCAELEDHKDADEDGCGC